MRLRTRIPFCFAQTHKHPSKTKLRQNANGVGINKDTYYPDQLWKFERVGQFYRLVNKVYPTCRIEKFGSHRANLRCYNHEAGLRDGQLWKITPRFRSNLGWKVLWHADNRQGSQAFTQTVRFSCGGVPSASGTKNKNKRQT